MRLDKFLCACQIGTRSEVKKYIKQGLVSVNGDTSKLKPEMHVDEAKDQVCFRGKALVYEEYIYYLLYKGKGHVTATVDSRYPTVMEYFPEDLRKCLTPVGRLDVDTEGLLLMTNDGNFTHHILSPNHHMPKTYLAELDAPIPESAVVAFAEGIDIGDDKPTLPAKLVILADQVEDESHRYFGQLTITEGRYHQVKRMFHAIGCEVTALKRLTIGNLNLDGLKTGEYRKLTPDEVNALYSSQDE